MIKQDVFNFNIERTERHQTCSFNRDHEDKTGIIIRENCDRHILASLFHPIADFGNKFVLACNS